jgi:dipeptidyl aminopeptidase/acylaminoacyl peptidase
MRRVETYWQGLVLLLFLLLTIGIYMILGLALVRLREARQAAALDPSAWPSDAVQIVEPLDGAILQTSASLPVHAAVAKRGFLRAELKVDGVSVGAQVNPAPRAVPWLSEWTWEQASEGAHSLALWAFGPKDKVEVSAPVGFTVVPSGTLLFASNREGAYAIYAMPTDGRDAARLTAGPGDARQPAVRQDGALAFVVETGTGQAMIRQVDSGGGAEQDLVAGRDPAWSPTGARLAYAASQQGISQVFATAAGAVGDRVAAQVTAEEVYAGQPAWAPVPADDTGGARLAYVAEREGNWDIWVTTLAGGEPRRLTDDPAMDWAPAWSPDGSRLAFVSDRGGRNQIYVMRADGADVRPLTAFPQGAESPCWSPDGFWLAFVAYSGEATGIRAREIYLMQADGRNQVRLTRNAFDDTEPDWAWGP